MGKHTELIPLHRITIDIKDFERGLKDEQNSYFINDRQQGTFQTSNGDTYLYQTNQEVFIDKVSDDIANNTDDIKKLLDSIAAGV